MMPAAMLMPATVPKAKKVPSKPSQLHQDVIDIVIAGQRNGASDMTRVEIQRAYEERVKNKRIGDGPFARTMSEISLAGWLLRRSGKRLSRVGVDADSLASPVPVFAYYAPAALVKAPVSSPDYY